MPIAADMPPPPTVFDNPDAPKPEKKKKFLNGWTREQEELMSKWSDIAMCYRWLHGRSEGHYKYANYIITIPVIILSTLTGTASVGLSSIVGDDLTAQKYAQLCIGGVSIITGILSTLGNYLRFAQLQEGNRVAAQSWGKFNRLISAELALHPDRRSDCQEFLKLCRTELDRLIEAAPELHSTAIREFNSRFGKINTFKMPDEADRLQSTQIFEDDNLRLKQLALDAAMVIRSKAELLKDMEFSDREISMFDRIEKRLKDNHKQEFGDYVVDTDSIVKEERNKSHETSAFSSNTTSRPVTPKTLPVGAKLPTVSSLVSISSTKSEKAENIIVEPEEHNRVYDKV